MALPDNTIMISNPHAAEQASFTLVQEKQNKKQQLELSQLGAILEVLEEELAQAKSGDAAPTPKASEKGAEAAALGAPSGPSVGQKGSSNSLEKAMVEMALALQMLERIISKADGAKAKMDGSVVQALVENAQENAKTIKKEIKKSHKDEFTKKLENFLKPFALLFSAGTVLAFDPKFLGKKTTHNPHAAEQSSFTRVQEKDKKKQQLELSRLRALLAELEEELAQAKSGDAAPTPKALEMGAEAAAPGAPSGPSVGQKASPNSFEKAMAEMAFALQMLEVAITKAGANKAKMDGSNAEAQVQLAQANLDNIKKQIAKMQKEEAKQKKEGFWEKFAEVVVTVVIDTVAVVTGNVALFLIATTMLVLSLTGALSKLTKGVADVLEDMGMPPKAAQIFAAVLVTVAIIIATLAFDPAAAVEDAVEEVEGAVDTGVNAANTVSEGAEESASTFQSAMSILKKIASPFVKAFEKTFGSLSLAQNLAITLGSFSAMQTGLLQDIATDIAQATGQKNSTLEEILEVTMEVIASLLMVLSGAGMMSDLTSVGSTATEIGEDASKFAKAMNKLQSLATSSKFSATFLVLNTAASLFESGFAFALGLTEMKQGELQDSLATLNANLQLIKADQDQSSATTKADQTHTADAEKSQSTGNQSIAKLMLGEAGLAETLTAFSPV